MRESHNDWCVIHGGADLLIEGPGHLKMALRSFSPAKIEHPSGASAQGTEWTAQCVWQYPLGPNGWLKLLNPGGQGQQPYRLQLGEDVSRWDTYPGSI